MKNARAKKIKPVFLFNYMYMYITEHISRTTKLSIFQIKLICNTLIQVLSMSQLSDKIGSTGHITTK